MTDKAEALYSGMSDSEIFQRGWAKAASEGKEKRFSFYFAYLWKEYPDMDTYKVSLNALHKCDIDVKVNLNKDQKDNDED